MKRKLKTSAKIILALGVFLVICLLLLIPPVSDKVGEWVGQSGETLRGYAQTAAGLTLGVLLVTWGIGALSVPILGGVMIVAGLGLIVWNLYPLWKKNNDLGS